MAAFDASAGDYSSGGSCGKVRRLDSRKRRSGSCGSWKSFNEVTSNCNHNNSSLKAGVQRVRRTGDLKSEVADEKKRMEKKFDKVPLEEISRKLSMVCSNSTLMEDNWKEGELEAVGGETPLTEAQKVLNGLNSSYSQLSRSIGNKEKEQWLCDKDAGCNLLNKFYTEYDNNQNVSNSAAFSDNDAALYADAADEYNDAGGCFSTATEFCCGTKEKRGRESCKKTDTNLGYQRFYQCTDEDINFEKFSDKGEWSDCYDEGTDDAINDVNKIFIKKNPVKIENAAGYFLNGSEQYTKEAVMGDSKEKYGLNNKKSVSPVNIEEVGDADGGLRDCAFTSLPGSPFSKFDIFEIFVVLI